MKSFFIFSFLLFLTSNPSFLYAQEVVTLSANEECAKENQILAQECHCERGIFESECIHAEDPLDPLESLNRVTFWVNDMLDMVLFEPISGMYRDLVPEVLRIRISYVLRNLNEPVVFANNLLQGEFEDARVTLGRFIFNSTLGVAGIFDVATDWGLPYKKQDLGLTFASWGMTPGPYIVLPILGPSTARDAWGRAGDFSLDPINIWAPLIQANTRTGIQIVDAKADMLDLDIETSLDKYVTIRSMYIERRKALARGVEEQQTIDTPRPDEDDE